MPDVLTRSAHLVRRTDLDAVAVLGPTIEYVTEPAHDDGPCLMIGTVPPGVVVPIHSHDDPETFVPISGQVLALARIGPTTISNGSRCRPETSFMSLLARSTASRTRHSNPP